MKRSLILSFLFAIGISSTVNGQEAGDTTWVQTYTFEEQNNPETAYDSPGRRWFSFPEDDSTEYQKILMYHTLKCFEDGTAGGLGFPCGEWDYLSYNYLYDHTGVMDSTLVTHPQFLLNNEEFDTANVVQFPYSHVQLVDLELTEVTNTISESVAYTTTGMMDLNYPFNTMASSSRTQVLYLASELLEDGLVAGAINGLQLDVSSIGDFMSVLTLRAQQTDDTELSSFKGGSWQELYAWSAGADENGWAHFHFNEAIDWDGESNLLFDFAQLNVTESSDWNVTGGDVGFNSVVHTTSPDDRYVHFNWLDEFKVPGEAFETLDEQVTVSFWLKGDEDIQPQNSTTFEGVNASNQRVLNSHTPWGNGRIYWDAGQEGGYDRIDKQASEDEYEGIWNHFAFTKNTATGIMKIYLNGEEWHSGTDKDNSMAGIVDFSVGAAAGWGNFYNGFMDEFQVWNVELDEATIADWMYRDLEDIHPNWENLLVYYKFNETNGNNVEDHSSNDFDGIPHGSPNRITYQPNEFFRNFELMSVRPNIALVQGEYETTTMTDEWSYTIPVAPMALTEWEADGNYAILTSIEYYYPEGNSYVYDSDGIPVDTTFWSSDFQLVNNEFSYYETFEIVDRYELGRYITPYGINLDLEEGWTWIYDVTDFALLLTDSVDLNCGNWQELLDLKFAFIHGTPPRDLNRIERIWNGNWGLSGFNDNIEPVTIEFNEEDEMARFMSVATGHGFGNDANNCAEFCYNVHELEVDGQSEWSWQIMQECADNPLFPQGGTWVYDRAGWCPGMEGRRYDFELTPWVDNGEVELDYVIETDPYGNYVFESYVFTYGAPNFTTDVEVSEILAPSNFRLHSRENPMCQRPVVRIRNNGSDPLTSVLFTFGVAGETMETYTWEGSLGFLESVDVTLNYDYSLIYEGPEEEFLTFEVSLSMPNGVEDENPSNNATSSNFVRPVVYEYGEGDDDDNRLILWTQTNAPNWETSYSIYNSEGNSVFESPYFPDSYTTYKDTIQLNQGCYTFHLKDTDDDGLSFFNNNDGNGAMRFKKVSGPFIWAAEPDFGKEIKHTFFWKTGIVSVDELTAAVHGAIKLYPNPAYQSAFLEVSDMDQDLTLVIQDAQGKIMINEEFKNPGDQFLKRLPISGWADGIYFVTVSDQNQRITQRLVIGQ